jgi:hypothetical protein
MGLAGELGLWGVLPIAMMRIALYDLILISNNRIRIIRKQHHTLISISADSKIVVEHQKWFIQEKNHSIGISGVSHQRVIIITREK